MKILNLFVQIFLLVAITTFSQENNSGSNATTSSKSNTIIEEIVLIPTDATWEYWDKGEYPGDGWTTIGYDSSGWSSGKAELGYRDGDEATIVEYGGNPTNRYITTYFRKTFTVENKSAISNLVLGVLRDDGVAVYLNGVEVFRNNMPSGEIKNTTRALKAVAGEAERKFLTVRVSPELLVNGENIIAAEVHQWSPTSVDMSFNLRLHTYRVIVNKPPTVSIVSPTNNSVLIAPATVEISAEASDTDDTVALVTFYANNKIIGVVSNAPYKVIWANVLPGEYNLIARAVDSSGAVGYSSAVRVVVKHQIITETLIPKGAVWKYLDDGSNQGTSWREIDFDDSSWAEGPAQLGYGDGDEATVVSYGPDPNNRYVTTYFRKSFNVESPSRYAQLVLKLLRDDGAAVYLNGIEVFRSNLRQNADYKTYARSAAGPNTENKYYSTTVNPALLMAGLNVVAVEVHQWKSNSVDLGFDLELTGRVIVGDGGVPPVVSITSPASGTTFNTGSDIPIIAEVKVGTDPVQWVEFFANGELIGRATTQPYQITWKPTLPGLYNIVAKATDLARRIGVSHAITITVTEPVNNPPTVVIVKPLNGASFTAPANIELIAEAIDSDGTISSVEFYTGSTLIGRAEQVVDEQGSATTNWRFEWTGVGPGNCTIVAKATDERGAVGSSGAIAIEVHTPETLPIVQVIAPDRLAVEATNDYGYFVITRSGSMESALTVYYELSGSASNGVDYTLLPGYAVIPEGESSVTITVEALADDLVENMERVYLRVVAPDCSAYPPPPGCYVVGESNIASVVIIDPIEYPPLPPGALVGQSSALVSANSVVPGIIYPPKIYETIRLPGGGYKLTIIGTEGVVVTIEASEDLQEWTPLTTQQMKDGGVLEFVDKTANRFNMTFYRVIIEK